MWKLSLKLPSHLLLRLKSILFCELLKAPLVRYSWGLSRFMCWINFTFSWLSFKHSISFLHNSLILFFTTFLNSYLLNFTIDSSSSRLRPILLRSSLRRKIQMKIQMKHKLWLNATVIKHKFWKNSKFDKTQIVKIFKLWPNTEI